jgi:hypothetical protein
VTGISGSPVYDQAAHALCGMVVRGGMTGSRCTIHYLDVFDIVRFLDAVSRGVESAYYTKQMPRPVIRANRIGDEQGGRRVASELLRNRTPTVRRARHIVK